LVGFGAPAPARAPDGAGCAESWKVSGSVVGRLPSKSVSLAVARSPAGGETIAVRPSARGTTRSAPTSPLTTKSSNAPLVRIKQ